MRRVIRGGKEAGIGVEDEVPPPRFSLGAYAGLFGGYILEGNILRGSVATSRERAFFAISSES